MAAIIIAAIITIGKLGYRYYDEKKRTSFSSKAFHSDQGWGYDILYGGKIIIHQPMIPGRAGLKGYDTEQEALAAAKVVLEQVKYQREAQAAKKDPSPPRRQGHSRAKRDSTAH